MNAIINVTNLRLRTFIGFNEEERKKQQDVIINAEIHYPVNDKALSDDVANALDYKVITKKVIALVEEGRFLLLERLAANILAICMDNNIVEYAKVRIDKPHALRFADSVSITLEENAKHFLDQGENRDN